MTNQLRFNFRDMAGRLVLLFTASYGLLYYCYKYFSPVVLDGDSHYYYPIYVSPLNWSAAQAPFVLRQFGAVLVHLVWKCHIFYPNKIANTDPAFDQHIFFAALFVNWVCLVLTAFLAGLIAEELCGKRHLLVFALAAFLCLLSFHAPVAVLTDTAEGPAWMLMALALMAFVRRSYVWLAIALVLAVFQREMILLAMGFLAALEMLPWRKRNRYAMFALALSIVCFVVYLVLRRKLGGGWEFQSHPTSLLLGLTRTKFSLDLLFQVVLVQNVIFIALAAFWLARFRPASVRFWTPRLLAAFMFLALVSLGSFEGNTTGRLAGVLTPMFAALAAVSLAELSPAEQNAERDTAYAGVSNLPSMAFLAASMALLAGTQVYRIVHPRPPKLHHLDPNHLPPLPHDVH